MNRTTTSSLIALTLVTLVAGSALAGDHPNERRGWFLGFDIGTGSSSLEYDRPAGKYESDDDEVGGAFGLRVGYGLTDRFLVSLDTNGYGQEDDDWETSIDTTVLMATYHLGGGGFFFRAGGGVGRVETELPADLAGSPAVEFKKSGPVLALGAGYEWRVGEKFALGLAIDARGGSIDDFDVVKDLTFGKSTLGLQFNWYL